MAIYLPKITVITVVRNDATGFRRTAESVRQQDYPDLEYIVIDGGSTDGTADVIREYAGRIACWISEPDKGPYDAMNKGLLKATGEWVNFMNAGDVFADKSTVSTVVSSELEGYGCVYGDAIAAYPLGKVLRRAKPPEKLKRGMVFCHQSVFVRRELIAIQGFHLTYKYGADFDMLLWLYLSGSRFKQLPFPVAVFDATGLSNQNMVQSAKEHYSIIKKHLKPNLTDRIYHNCFIGWLKLVMFGYKMLPKKLLNRVRGM